MRRRFPARMKLWLLAIAVAAVAISIPAGSASGGGISVEASFGGCQPGSGDGIVCNVTATFTGVRGADYYTASVIAPNGATQNFGQVPAGSASLWPRYSGNGTYTVRITAWDDGGKVKRGSGTAGG